MAVQKSRRGLRYRHPLRWAVRLRRHVRHDGAELTVIRDILAADTSAAAAAATADKWGCLPLHNACRWWGRDRDSADAKPPNNHHHLLLTVLQLLVEAHPAALLTPQCDGLLPLHVALRHDAPVAAIEYLIDQCPQALNQVTNDGLYPLHMAAQHSSRTDVVMLLVARAGGPEPLLLKPCRAGGGLLPLHYACQNPRRRQQQGPAVAALVRACPSSGTVRGTHAFPLLPVEVALQHGTLGMVEHLVDACPEALALTNAQGMTPLHFAVANGASVDKLRVLVHGNLGALGVEDPYGHFPLHSAAERFGGSYSSLDDVAVAVGALQFLAELSPAPTFLARSGRGLTPLHVAVEAYSREHLRSGPTPVHVALMEGFVECIQLLVDLCPAAVEVKDNEGWTPLHTALRCERTHPVLQCLVDACSEALLYNEEVKGNRNSGGILSLALKMHPTLTPQVVHALVNKCPRLLEIPDNDKRHPLHCALVHGWYEYVPCLVEAQLKTGPPGLYRLEYAVVHGAPPHVVKCLADACPPRSQNRYHNMQLLHYALREDATVDVVRVLVDRFPDAMYLFERDEENYKTALHTAAMFASLDVVQLLADRYPEALTERGEASDGTIDGGSLPLHLAAAHSRFDVVQLLADLRPDTLQAKTYRGMLPLHFAIDGKFVEANCEVVQFLVDRCPYALDAPAMDCWLSLAIENNAPLDVVEALVVRCPQALQVKDREGNLLLHRVVAADRDWDTYWEVLVRGFPDALLCKSDAGLIPLHLAVQHYHVQLHDVQFLVNTCRESLRVTATSDGRLALHIAAATAMTWENRERREVLRGLADPYPEALEAKDHRGWLPLHVAAQCATLDVVQYLVSARPRSALEATSNDGWLALHVATQYATLDVVQYLANASPGSALEATTHEGWLALHVAAKRGDLPLIQCLVEHGGHESLRLPTRKEGWLPYHVAAVHDAPLSVVYYLLRMMPPNLG